MKRSRRELSINMIIHRSVFQNNQITLFPCFTVSYLKQGLVFTVLTSDFIVLFQIWADILMYK